MTARFETERTEELVALMGIKDRRRRTVFVAVCVVAGLALLLGSSIGLMQWKRHGGQSKRYLSMGDKYVQEGDYQRGIDYYTKAISVDKKNPKSYIHRGDAYMKKNGRSNLTAAEKDYSKAADLDKKDTESRQSLVKVYKETDNYQKLRKEYRELWDITGEDKYEILAERLNRGNTSSNLNNGGFFLETEKGAYVANTPAGGISKVSENGDLTLLWRCEEPWGEHYPVVGCMNEWDGYIYFLLVGYSNSERSDVLCRIDIDGGEAEEIVVDGLDTDSIGGLKIIGGEFLFEYSGVYDSAEEGLYKANLDGSNVRMLQEGSREAFECDESYLYSIVGNGTDEESCFSIERTNLETEETISWDLDEEENQNVNDLILYQGALYISSHSWEQRYDEEGNMKPGIETSVIYRLDPKEGETVELVDSCSVEHTSMEPAIAPIAVQAGEVAWVHREDGIQKLNRVDLKGETEDQEPQQFDCEEGDVSYYFLAGYKGRFYGEDMYEGVEVHRVGSMKKDGTDQVMYRQD